MSQNYNKNLDFLTPETLALVVLIHEVSLDFDQAAEPSSPLINRILHFYSSESSPNLETFLSNLLNELPDQILIARVQSQFNEFIQINDIYKYLSTTLKVLRSNRSGKLEQGSIVDIFIRRALLTFTKWSFNDLVRFHNSLQLYKNSNKNQKPSNNPFAFEKNLDELKNSLENAPPGGSGPNNELFEKKINDLKVINYNTKLDYLRFKNLAKQGKSMDALESLHKYFDKSLNYLLQVSEPQEKSGIGQTQNKINHAILNLANINFNMGFYDEVLRGVSEALRISQNNADDESINHCLCYLYQIAGILGNSEDQLSLLEYAISHSLNLNNPILMLNSCLYYCTLERFYDVRVKDPGYLKARNISWTNALHYASKKLITSYESGLNLKDISHMKNLWVPRALERVVVALNLAKLAKPNVVMMQLATIYNTADKDVVSVDKVAIQLYEIAYYVAKFDWVQGLKMLVAGLKDTDGSNDPYFKYYWYMIHHGVFLNKGMMGYSNDLEELIVKEFKVVHEVALYSQFWAKRIERMLAENRVEEAFYSGMRLKEFNEKKGVIKLCMQGLMSTLEGYFKESKDFKGLLVVEEVLLKISEFEIQEYEALTLCYKAAFLRNLGLLYEAFKTIKQLEEDPNAFLYNSDLKTQGFFFEMKGLCLLSQAKESAKNLLKLNGLEALNLALVRYIKLGNLKKCKEIYYIQARILDELDKVEEREEVAALFMKTVDLQGKLEGMKHFGGDALRSLDLLHFQMEIQNIIEDNLKIINFGN